MSRARLSLERYASLPSTQTAALERAREGAPAGTLLWAEEQSEGRGQAGREWYSPRGGAYFSLLLRVPSARLPLLSLAAGAEVRDRLQRRASPQLWIKWPNDLLVVREDIPGARKLGGILVDVLSVPGQEPVAVVGVGVNVARPPSLPAGLQERVGFLAEMAVGPTGVEDLVWELAEGLLSLPATLAPEDAARRVVGRVDPWLWGRGRAVRWAGGEGLFLGLGKEGEALVRSPEGSTHRLSQGDLEWEGW
jgi:BirA family biotin operon repressor/biotin-[acetyl-CoA-carboxylase] ligase